MSRLILLILLGSVISLLGTTLGALIGISIGKPSRKLLGALIGFSGGLMFSVVVFDLIPEALQNWSFVNTVLTCISGIILVSFIDTKLQHDKMDKHIKMALMTAIGLMIHNFPEGVIMGCGFAAGSSLGIKMSLIIAIHDIPEGIAISAPLMITKVKRWKILFYTIATATPTILGTLVGAYIGKLSTNALGLSLSFASGIMLYVVCGEMIPESSKLWEGVSSTLGILAGVIFGLVLINIL
ncbi:ZIP family metal transporter [Clostridium sp. MSJ-11]|uniref:ZIP family metal transporter n=1 Tax=Clostridium mobile TaxID=2841512 RepID=A0ABS6ELY2_9CLOT|nr:ZIP family metal transporter [Clostridium mobile]MBU5486132.1 ZIP family metal transporter [Clostridium mobile]